MRFFDSIAAFRNPLAGSHRRVALLLFAIALALLAAGCRDVDFVVGILEPDEGDAVEEARTGFLEALSDAGFKAGENARFLRRNAEFRDEPLQKLARDLIENEEVDYLFAIGTPALQAAIGAAKGKQVFFAASADPTVGGASEPPWLHRTILGGAVAYPLTAETVSVLRRLAPDTERFALLYDARDPDSVAGRDLARDEARRSGFEVVAIALTGAGQVQQAVRDAIDAGAQGIVLSPANLLDDEFDVVRRAAADAGVPVFAWSESLTKRGALASWGIDYQRNGRRAGELAAAVFRGEGVPQRVTPPETAVHLWLNQRTADRLGIALPNDLVAQAREVFR